MKKMILTMLVLAPLLSRGQNNIKKYVLENSVRILTIFPDSASTSDLEYIGKAIGDSKIVMLGEQDHGDAPTFLAKTRIIKYLHEKKGFNVLAFESDFFGLNYGWETIEKTPAEIDSFIHKSVFGMWASCDVCAELFYDYLPKTYKTSDPLILSGFDSQLFLHYTKRNLPGKIDSLLYALDLPTTRRSDYPDIEEKIHSFISGGNKLRGNDYAQYLSEVYTCLMEIKSEAKTRLNKNDFWLVVLENLIQLNIEYQNKIKKNINDFSRDSMMAENLLWLAKNKFKNEKIIVWAASFHIAKWKSGSETKINSTMGDFFAKDSLVKESYIMGFTSFKGETGILGLNKYKVQKAKRNGFESWVDTSYNYSFLDFNAYNKSNSNDAEKFYLKGIDHYYYKEQWNKIFDGIFFIREMYSCKKNNMLSF